MRVEIFKLRERVWRKKKERHKGNGVEKKGKRTQKVKRMEEWNILEAQVSKVEKDCWEQ